MLSYSISSKSAALRSKMSVSHMIMQRSQLLEAAEEKGSVTVAATQRSLALPSESPVSPDLSTTLS